MSSLNEINRHIRSVDMTRQLSNAMFLLSSSRAKKVMSHIEYNRTYYHRVRQTMKEILVTTRGESIASEYLNPEVDEKKTMYIVISSDKGLCGNYNHNILNLAWKHMKENPPALLCTAGIMGRNFFNKKGIHPDIELLGMVQDPKLSFARNICDDILEYYDSGEINEVLICYTHFESAARQYPEIRRLLPLKLEDFEDEEIDASHNRYMLYEPSPDEIFRYIVPLYLTGIIHQALCMSYTSENSSRMTAMQNSTKNADKMLAKLKMQYNRKRQLKITQDITEIASGSRHKGGVNRYGKQS